MSIAFGRLRLAIDALQGSYWLIPALMSLGALLLAATTQTFTALLQPDPWRGWFRWVTTAGPDGARAILTTIAGSMMTLASLTYSLTLVALTLAAGQYGPRLLRTFMRDRVTQISLGAFLATFVYCLASLRTVGGPDVEYAVPHLAVAISGVMTALCLGYLVYFIHHVASSINASSVIDTVSHELRGSIRSGEPSADRTAAAAAAPAPLPHTARPIAGTTTGYVTITDIDALVSACEAHDGRLWLTVRAGDFVLAGDPLAYELVPGRSLQSAVLQAVAVGPERTMLQDAEFGVAQLVEVALRALSPGINDPFTAIACVDRLSEALVLLARRGPVPGECRDTHGQLRVVRLRVPSFDGALRAAFDPLRQYARGHTGVLVRLGEALGRIARTPLAPEERAAVARQLEMLEANACASVPEPRDRDDVLARVAEASAALEAASGPPVAS